MNVPQLNLIIPPSSDLERLPEAVSIARARLTLAPGQASKLTGGVPLERVVLAALEAGRDPSTDPEVQQAVTAHYIANLASLGHRMQQAVAADLAQAVRAHVDDIVELWREDFDAAAAILVTAHAALAGLPLDRTDDIVRKGGGAAEHWGAAQSALKTLATIDRRWLNLYQLLRPGSALERRHAFFKFSDLDPAAWVDPGAHAPAPTAWDALGDGLNLRLQTPAEYRQLVRAASEAAGAREAAAERRPPRPSYLPLKRMAEAG